MGILIAFAIIQLLHEFGRSVPDHQRNRLIQLLKRIFFGFGISDIAGIRFRRERKIDHGLGKMDSALRHADVLTGLEGRHRNLKRVGIGQPHVFGREAGHPPSDVKGILPRFKHPGEPINGGIRIAIAH